NEGDVSPNTKGAFCWNGSPCEEAHSTCGGASQGCHGYGPGKDNNNFENVRIIGTNQMNKALELYNTANVSLAGPVSFVHTFVDMSAVTVDPKWSGLPSAVSTCM